MALPGPAPLRCKARVHAMPGRRRPPGLGPGWAPTQSADTLVHTRPAEFLPTRPMALETTRPVPVDATRPVPLSPTRPLPPGAVPLPADTHWQRRGAPGQHLMLMPGQMHLGQQVASLRTLLGSCVAITLWHPQRRIGGMCHYLLPQRLRPRHPSEPPNGRFGDEAVAEMVRALVALHTHPCDYQAHLHGGADTMPSLNNPAFDIGARNIAQGRALIAQHGFQLASVDVGAHLPCLVTLCLDSGALTLRRGSSQGPAQLPP